MQVIHQKVVVVVVNACVHQQPIKVHSGADFIGLTQLLGSRDPIPCLLTAATIKLLVLSPNQSNRHKKNMGHRSSVSKFLSLCLKSPYTFNCMYDVIRISKYKNLVTQS
ncbi:unnamed protein product [Camellia sinensis]